jgi:O-methyltransferase involved in polyketide biosynthesis
MTAAGLAETELALAAAKDVQQCVLIGSQPPLAQVLKHLEMFALGEEEPADLEGTFVPTDFQSEALAAALAKSRFDKLKGSLFVWLGGAGYRTVDAAVSTLGYIAALPKGSGVLLDYVAERSALRSLADSALDVLASRMYCATGVKHLIQPQAVTAMLRSIGFHHIVDLPREEGPHLVAATV